MRTHVSCSCYSNMSSCHCHSKICLRRDLVCVCVCVCASYVTEAEKMLAKDISDNMAIGKAGGEAILER